MTMDSLVKWCSIGVKIPPVIKSASKMVLVIRLNMGMKIKSLFLTKNFQHVQSNSQLDAMRPFLCDIEFSFMYWHYLITAGVWRVGKNCNRVVMFKVIFIH